MAWHLLRVLPVAWAIGAAGSGAPPAYPHPLCKALESYNNDDMFLQSLPAKYVCHGSDDGLACAASGIEKHEPAFQPREGNQVVGDAGQETLGAQNRTVRTEAIHFSSWWVCGGHADTEVQAKGISAATWIRCGGYVAVGGNVSFPSRICEASGTSTAGTRAEGHDDLISTYDRLLHGDLGSTNANPLYSHYHRRTVEEQRHISSARVLEPMIALEWEQNDFVQNSGVRGCTDEWTLWPEVHKAAIENGTILLFRLFPSVGNLFIALHNIIKVVRFLEVGLVLDWGNFPGFRDAFDPSSIDWEQHPKNISQRDNEASGVESAGLHSFEFRDGVLVVSDHQLERLGRLDLVEESPADPVAAAAEALKSVKSLRALTNLIGKSFANAGPCAWNLLLRRRYIFNEQPSSTVFPLYLAATGEAERRCRDLQPGSIQDIPVFISSNSKSMTRNCSGSLLESGIMAGYVDLGIAETDAHTSFSKDPATTATNAFLDFLSLMDAFIIVRTSSSFSGTVATIKGLKCTNAKSQVKGMPNLSICFEKHCL